MNKLLTFIGPPHHSQLIRPIEQELLSRGWVCEHWVADTESCFQVGLEEYYPGLPFHWLPDYTDIKKADAVYQQHKEWFRSFYDTPNALSLVLPQTLDRIVTSTCREWVGIGKLLQKVKPTACLALHEINRWGRMLGAHCQMQGVPFWTLQEGLYYGEPWLYTAHTKYSHSCVWGESTRNLLLQAGASPDRLHVTGHPDLLPRWKAASPYPLPEAGGKKVVFLFLTNTPIAFQPAMLDGWEQQEDYHLVVMIHQMASLPFIKQVGEYFAGKRGVTVVGVGQPGDIWRVLKGASILLLIGCSSMTLEWLFPLLLGEKGRPILVVPSPLPNTRNYTVDPPVALNGSDLPFLGMVKLAPTWEASCGEAAVQWVRQELSGGVEGAVQVADLMLPPA
jgi:hypothetical protein